MATKFKTKWAIPRLVQQISPNVKTSNYAVLRKEVPFYCYKILFFTYLFEKFEKITMAPMGKI